MRGTLQPRYVRCGRKNCRCATDPEARHGPYWYLEWRKGRKICKRYVPADKLETVREWLASRQALEQAIDECMTDMKAMRESLRILSGMAAPRRRGEKLIRYLVPEDDDWAEEYLTGTF
ncbi:MAG: DUF6788 family protein [Armatimonadota bacterium]